MDRQRQLKRLKLTQAELDDLLAKWRNFHKSLNPAQRRVIDVSFRSTETALKTFGSDCTPKDLLDLVGGDEHAPRVLMGCVPEDCPPEDDTL